MTTSVMNAVVYSPAAISVRTTELLCRRKTQPYSLKFMAVGSPLPENGLLVRESLEVKG
jgi:hypothetical protein